MLLEHDDAVRDTLDLQISGGGSAIIKKENSALATGKELLEG
jgi:hypothetical protein